MEDLKFYLQAGMTVQFLEKMDAEKVIKCFQKVFQLFFEKLNGHLSSLPAYQYYKCIRIFDPHQLPAVDHDIEAYSSHLKPLANLSSELLEEWLIYTQY